jgi:hypothetical protein
LNLFYVQLGNLKIKHENAAHERFKSQGSETINCIEKIEGEMSHGPEPTLKEDTEVSILTDSKLGTVVVEDIASNSSLSKPADMEISATVDSQNVTNIETELEVPSQSPSSMKEVKEYNLFASIQSSSKSSIFEAQLLRNDEAFLNITANNPHDTLDSNIGGYENAVSPVDEALSKTCKQDTTVNLFNLEEGVEMKASLSNVDNPETYENTYSIESEYYHPQCYNEEIGNAQALTFNDETADSQIFMIDSFTSNGDVDLGGHDGDVHVSAYTTGNSDGESYVTAVSHAEVGEVADQNTLLTSIGEGHALPISPEGEDVYLYAYGNNFFYQLGIMNDVDQSTSFGIPFSIRDEGGCNINIAAMANGNHFSVALSSDGIMYQWGVDYKVIRKIPTCMHLPIRFIQERIVGVSCGLAHSIAFSSSGCAFSWYLYTYYTYL